MCCNLLSLSLTVIFVRLFVSLVANSSNWRTLALNFYCKMIFLNCIFFKERNKLTNKTLTWIQQIIRTYWFTEKNIQFSQRWWQITHDSLRNRVSKLTWLYALSQCDTCIHNISQWSVLFWSLNGSLSTSTWLTLAALKLLLAYLNVALSAGLRVTVGPV